MSAENTSSSDNRQQVATISSIVEESRLERVLCEIRDGQPFFIFRTDAAPNRQAVVHADDYIAVLEELRENAKQRPFARIRFRAEETRS